MPHFPDEIEYSEKYQDDNYEYRHVLLPRHIYKQMPHNRMLFEQEWRSLGVQQSRGWVHYEIHTPEPFILLFRRPIVTDPQTGMVPMGHPLYEEHKNMLNDPNYNRRPADAATTS
jgi:cyclin-dependent kinase regulatory subunit CKS1